MANYPYELAQDAAYQSHTGRLTGLWFLPKLAQGLNTNNNKHGYYTRNSKFSLFLVQNKRVNIKSTMLVNY
jgi:hypothetical protein